MTILNTGLNKVRDLLDAGLTEGDWGTGTASSFPTDSGLQAEVAGVEVVTTNSTGDKTVSVTAILPSTSGGTAVLAEHAVRFSDGVDFARLSFSPITKSNAKEIHNITTIVVTGN